VNGLTMDFPLTVSAIVRRCDALFRHKAVTSRLPDRRIVRHTYGEIIDRSRRLAVALRRLGVMPGDRVATLGWNHHQHLEAYFAIPTIGAVLHTLNLRLHPDDLASIAHDAGDTVVLADESLLPLLACFRSRTAIGRVIVMARTGGQIGDAADYEELIARDDSSDHVPMDNAENAAAAICYTSGTTGSPKGVVYSHRAIVLHSLVCGMTDGLGVCERDTIMPVVSMFHVNAWGLPFAALMTGANLVLPGPCLDAASILELCQQERVTCAAGVPTVWLGVLATLDAAPGAYDLSRLRRIFIGGAAAPAALIQALEERHGVRVVHAWGMTESAPLGSVCWVTSDLDEALPEQQLAHRATQGFPVPLVEFRARSEQGLVPWDGISMGELEMRGAWVAKAYYGGQGEDRFADDGWFKTGDIVTISPRGAIEIRDRSKDVVKSGGEWISSVALECSLMGHPAVAEAAVVAVPHAKWGERPLAVVVMKSGCCVTEQELIAYLEPGFVRWWLPDAVVFVDEIPRTAAGKFRKTALRDRFRTHYGVT